MALFEDVSFRWESITHKIPPMHKCVGKGWWRTYPVFVMLNYHCYEETEIVIAIFRRQCDHWNLQSLDGVELPLDSVVAWAEIPDSENDFDEYLNNSCLKAETLERLFSEQYIKEEK